MMNDKTLSCSKKSTMETKTNMSMNPRQSLDNSGDGDDDGKQKSPLSKPNIDGNNCRNNFNSKTVANGNNNDDGDADDAPPASNVNNDGSTGDESNNDSVPAEMLEVRTMAMAAIESLNTSAGAYRIDPGRPIIRLSSNERGGENEEDPEAPDDQPVVSDSNILPANIDIIAEATLVDDDLEDGASNNNYDNPDLNDENAALEADVEMAADSEGEEQDKELYEATRIDDGPMAVLRTRSGKLITGISLLIVVLSLISLIGLAVGLSSKKPGGGSNNENNNQQQVTGTLQGSDLASGKTSSGSDDIQEQLPPRTQSQETEDDISTQEVAQIQEARDRVKRTAGDFCGGTPLPQVFYDESPSLLCSKEQLSKGGILQQAVATLFDRRGSGRTLDIATNYCDADVTKLPDEDQETFTTTCGHIIAGTHFVLLHGGMVQGAIPANTTITSETFGEYVSFDKDSAMAVLLLKKDDATKLLNNAMDYVTQDDPLNIEHSIAYPYTGRLRYDVNLSATSGQKVSNLKIYNPITRDWIPASKANFMDYFVIVTNRWIAEGNGGYLDGIEPMYLDITSLNYEDEIVGILEQMEGDYWMPPTLDEMSTSAFYD